MNIRRVRRIAGRAPLGLMGACVLVCAACLVFVARGQQGPVTHSEDTSPPPMKYIPSEIRAQLDGERELKDRTRLSLELAEQRLARAAEETTAERFEQAGSELGVYQAVIEDAIHFLRNTGKIKNKTRDLFKRIELTLRSHMPRLETIRRSTPSSYAVHVKETMEFVRQSRTDALNSFFDDTVLPEPSDKNEKPGDEHAKGTPLSVTGKEKKPQQR
ncbi:MAG: hypothetical protein LC754_13490 [Acidobacteria bacterium]|nr:hypothetical protein [Acidobacteriota bacterium]